MISLAKTLTISKMVFSIFIIFHICITIGIILFDIVPVDYLWGGQLKTKDELFVFELISISIQTLCLLFVVNYRKHFANKTSAIVIAWILFVIFLLNTVGNLFAQTLFEKVVFTPVTLVLGLLMLRIAMDKKIKSA